ncbi:class I SAM-dependent methyltransferase [Succinatimonas hippei]|uniref:class I SAM-dependent methyltransferase n=1 Tax=Succinatimonas hippei TaxID=626938 RepID=UPI0026F1EC8A|nr:class I SAM-dependent methyltransferase [Succinatimonas hippei]
MQQLNAIADYWSLRSHGYRLEIEDELNQDKDSFYAHELLSRVKKHNFSAAPTALDLGCGPGFFSILLAQNGFKVTGIDLSDGMLQQAKELCQKRKLNVNLLKADVQNPPFAPESFDLIVSRNVFWDLPDLTVAYKNALKLLKKSGLLIIFDGNHYYYYADPDYKMTSWYDTHSYLENVDVTIIDDIAKNLPASFKLRPEYDLQILNTLKPRHVTADILKTRRKNGKELIDFFVIEAIKG